MSPHQLPIHPSTPRPYVDRGRRRRVGAVHYDVMASLDEVYDLCDQKRSEDDKPKRLVFVDDLHLEMRLISLLSHSLHLLEILILYRGG